MFLKEYWGHFSGIQTSGDVNNFERTLMPSEEMIKKDKKNRDKDIAKLIMNKANSGCEQEVIWLAMRIVSP